jgi:hypothetical protein
VIGVVVMARAPVPGAAKTRLEPLLGAEGAARLQGELIRHTLAWSAAAAPTWLALTPPDAAFEGLVPGRVERFAQADGELGARMAAAAGHILAVHDGPVAVIGTDAPLLGPRHLAAAEAALAAGHDAAIVPARDGGYVLIALARELPAAFELSAPEWGGRRVLELTRRALQQAGLTVAILDAVRDLDTPADALALRADPRCPAALRRALEPLVSIVVPVLGEEAMIGGLLDHLASLPGRWERIVADGGSSDRTCELAGAHPSAPRIVHAPRGRANQMNAGAAVAGGEVVLFLHADTRLPAGAHASVTAALADPALLGGNFALRFDGEDRFSRLLGRWYALQRRAGIYYGDSAIWLRRAAFERLGGYRPLPIMEDYDLVRRLQRDGPTRCLPGPARTSARRWERYGLARTIGSWVVIRWLFIAGVEPRRLARLYPHAR